MQKEFTDNFMLELEDLQREGNLRFLRKIETHNNRICYEGKDLLNLCSNDYLGLASDQVLQDRFKNYIASNALSMASSSSRLLTGNHAAYDELEEQIRSDYSAEAALVFNSGYHANLGILPAVTSKGDVILADKLVHASINDGLRLCNADFVRYRHLDYNHLERLLKKYCDGKRRVVIVTESVFSMDGDVADLSILVALKEKYGALLYVDDAHGIGVLGENGLGLAEQSGHVADIDFLVGTFGKALASVGAYVVCSEVMRKYLINKMRTLIFTTALPPVNLAWTRLAWVRCKELKDERDHLKKISNQLRDGIQGLGAETCGDSHIIPYIVGENVACMNLSEFLCKRGFFVLPIKHPTVPKGTARLRFSLMANMKETEIAELVEGLSLKQ
ncbi:8-amino-7-oxononanoate synthase [Puteibacter caeruleilacunae]|nr:8-amino-7-oxononanoate synthase [Puteibacter caeruleilacunae]